MQRSLKRPGYRLHPPASPEAGALLAEQGLGSADLDRALAGLERSEGTPVRTIVGINEDGVFGISRAGWRPDLPDAFIPLLWVKVHELLGRVPDGSTARFIQDGTLPREDRRTATGTGCPAETIDRTTDRPRLSHHAAAASRPAAIFSLLFRSRS
jgi:hypothetical protein